MKALGKIIFYLLATVVLGALLAPPLYWAAQWLTGHGGFGALGEIPFRRFFHRSLLVAALVLLWPTVRWLRLPGVRALGLEPNPRRWRDAALGFSAAFGMMAALGGVMLALGIVELRHHVHAVSFLKFATSAVAVAFLEEWLFRGAILGLLARTLPPGSALVATSALFSILHFLKPNDAALPQSVHWLSGFAQIPGAFAQFGQPWLVLGGFTTLFCVGWILGWARLRTHSLWLAIGLHAGWVFGLKVFSENTRRLLKAKATLPWFGETLYVGLGSVAAVVLTGLLVHAWLSHVRTSSPDSARRG